MSPRRIMDYFSLAFSKFSQISLVACATRAICENFEKTLHILKGTHKGRIPGVQQ